MQIYGHKMCVHPQAQRAYAAQGYACLVFHGQTRVFIETRQTPDTVKLQAVIDEYFRNGWAGAAISSHPDGIVLELPSWRAARTAEGFTTDDEVHAWSQRLTRDLATAVRGH